jgi:hypothetical protein
MLHFLFNEEIMTTNGYLMMALTVTGSAVLAAVLAVKRRARLVDATDEHQKALQRWEDDTGNVLSAKPFKRSY